MPIYFYRRQCRWKGCNIFMPLGTHQQYCDEHHRDAFIKARVKAAMRQKKMRDEIAEMKRAVYEEAAAPAGNSQMMGANF